MTFDTGAACLFDAAMWFTPMDKWSQIGDPEVKPYSEGVPISTKSFAHFVQANDANQRWYRPG
jgi:hypothetical protein